MSSRAFLAWSVVLVTTSGAAGTGAAAPPETAAKAAAPKGPAAAPPAIAAKAAAQPAVAAQAPSAPSLDRAVVSARGRQSALLRVPAFGRYAVRVESKQGTALQLVDRMAGPGGVAGRAGEGDGRLDLFLDRGEYKLVTLGHRAASGEAKLDVRSFRERHAQAPLLVELKPIDEELPDFEQASYWLDVPKARTVWLEAAGRSLADLRLWRDGTWLVDAEPEREVVQPIVGRPLGICRLVVALEPGLYLLTAYGGAPRPWAVEDAASPFHLRYGIPSLGAAGRQRMTLSAFGRDRYLVPGKTSFFRLELPEARPATLEVGSDLAQPFAHGGESAEITKTSRPPVAELLLSGDTPESRVVSVSGEAGQPFVLQHFELRDEYGFDGSGAHWLGTVHAGAAADSIDATGILVRSRRPGENGPWEPFAEQTIPLDLTTGWARRANLLDTATLFVRVRQAGSYEISTDLRAEVLVEPFFLGRPPGYSAPPRQASPSRWDLDAGDYVVTLHPIQKGVARIVMRPKGLVDRALDALGVGHEQALLPPRPAVRFAEVQLDTARHYTLYLNQQPEVHVGVVVRELPLDLSEPLPIAQSPGETVSVPFRSAEPGTLTALAEDGQKLELSLDGGAWDKQPSVAPGTHQVAVRGVGDATVVYALAFAPQRLAATTPLPPLPNARLATLPRFAVLTAAKAQHFDLGREASRSFLLRAERAGLYRVQSTGLLATEGTLRSRTITSLATAAQNGVGRNFAVGQYLREGDYQVTAKVVGQSRGHLGLELVETRAADGGDLRSRIPARVTLPAGEAVVYRFTITTPGRFRVRSLGLGRSFECRLEDEQGWPLVKPGGTADLTRDFEPGRYRFLVLPETTPARVVTVIEPVAAPQPKRGHGPHRLLLARRVEHVWMEPASGERVPDRWDFKLPASAKVRIELDGGMQGRLLAQDAPDAKPIEVPLGQGFEGTLASGAYRLEAVSARPNNQVSYGLAVWPEPLVAGLDRVVSAPSEVPVSIGPSGLYELTSFGTSDVRGRLYDSEGRELARSDDRPDDWNLQIARTLGPGSYSLRLEPVGAASASTTLSLRRREEKQEKPLSLPAETDLHPGSVSHLYPLVLGAGSELVSAVARGREAVGVALELREGEVWRTVASATGRDARAESALASGREYRLRVWSLDRRDAPAHLTLSAPAAVRTSEAKARAGLRLPAPSAPNAAAAPAAKAGVASAPQASALAIAIERPGAFRVEGPGVVWCAEALTRCSETNGIVSSPGPTLWVLGEPGVTVRATRVALDATPVPLALSPAGETLIDVADGPGPVLVHAASQGGQPGLAVGKAAELRRSPVLAVGTRAAVAVALASGRLAVKAWDASPGLASAGAGITADVEALRFPRAEAQDARESLEGRLEAGAVRVLRLPHGAKRVRLALSASLVAALSHGDAVDSVHWAENAPLNETIETEADRLTLFPPREGDGRYALELFGLDSSQRTPALAPGAAFDAQPAAAGTRRLAVAPASAASRLAVRGASGPAVFVSSEGTVLRGSDLDVPPGGGTLLVPHGTGLVVAMREPLALAAGEKALALQPPAAFGLEGPVQTLRVETKAPALLHLRAPGPALGAVKRGDGPALVELFRDSVLLDSYTPGGRQEITLRALGGGTLHGAAELTATPVQPIGEGLGPELLLAPGQSRLFSFTVVRPGAIGIAVRADADEVDTVLLSSAGKPLGRGSMQMPTLEPGSYLLAIQAPADAAPVRVRPALVGIQAPDTGPPEDVVKAYLNAPEEELGAVFTARHVETAPEVEGEYGEGSRDSEGEEGTAVDESADEPAADETDQPAPDDAGASEGGLS